jgi:hypothetical protein
MKANLDFELYLQRMELNFEKLQDGMWMIQDESDPAVNILVIHRSPIVLFRIKLMEWEEVSTDRREDFFRTLLELNRELMHGAFAIEGHNLVLFNTLEAQNLDFNEFQASVDALSMAVMEYYPVLTGFRQISDVSGIQTQDEEYK